MIQQIQYPLAFDAHCAQFACQFGTGKDDAVSAADLSLVLPAELDDAIGKRKNEYLAGRWCTQQAMKELRGPWQDSISNDENRAPVWPTGFVGSITHSHGFAAAVVANRAQIAAIGIDSEKIVSEQRANKIQAQILTKPETNSANQLLTTSFADYVTLIFSAKESIFKCLYPHVRRYFGFHDAIITLNDSTPGRFEFSLQKDLSERFTKGFRAQGYYAKVNDFYHTGIVLQENDTAQD